MKIEVIRYNRAKIHDTQIVKWRKHTARYKLLRAELLALFQAKGFGRTEIKEWLHTRVEALRDRTPKQLLNLRSIAVLMRYARKALR